VTSAIFLKKMGSGTHSDRKFGLKCGEVLVKSLSGEKVPERRFGLGPSEKELLEWRSSVFYHKNTPGCNSESYCLHLSKT
jgi:hypothetical protein